MKQTIYDTHGDLLIKRYGEGIKLYNPNEFNNSSDKIYSISELMSLPLNIYFLSCDSVIKNLNENAVAVCGFPSIKKTIGHTVHVAAKKECAEIQLMQDKLVLKEKRLKIMDQYFMRFDEISFSATALRFPWYGNDNKIIGIFVIAFALGPNFPSLASSLESITGTGLLSSGRDRSSNTIEEIIPGREFNGVYLSQRELECMRFLFSGKTAKMTAKTLGLSPRTVEHYLENIKAKFNVSSKSDLLDKVING